MCPSMLMLKIPIESAMSRFEKWINRPVIQPPIQIQSRNTTKKACNAKGQWKGISFLVASFDEWTVFEEMSGGLMTFDSSKFKQLAQSDEMRYIGYNDSVPYGNVLVIQSGKVKRDFLDDKTDPSASRNIGRLKIENKQPLESWIDVEYNFTDDFLKYTVDSGLLWIFEWNFDNK